MRQYAPWSVDASPYRVLGVKPLAALVIPWLWSFPSSNESGIDLPASDHADGDVRNASSTTDTQDGFAHVWGYSVFHFDLYSWIRPG